MTRALWTTIAHAFRRTALPLAAYYVVTLAVPLGNGAARSGAAFVEHALAVVVVPPAVIVLACAVHTIGRASARAARSCFLAELRPYPRTVRQSRLRREQATGI